MEQLTGQRAINDIINMYQNTKASLLTAPALFTMIGVHHGYILTPSEIGKFVERLKETKQLQVNLEDPSKTYLVGAILSGLVQRSYEEGHNNFIIPCEGTRISSASTYAGACTCVECTQKNRGVLKVVYKGNVGDWFAWGSHGCDLTVEGDVGTDACSYIQDCNVTILGNVGDRFGMDARNSEFTVGSVKSVQNKTEK